ncbi:hypothetical protein [uncultured Microbulbifer sp.]|uniref:hypothetical protein n=1 Tax=uncultured Microbulbifer sp. TaxID=348147 RepID=UPI0025CCBB47|nr:hypothetical protein [uncultured Microbulbifer sp.]
MKYLYSLIVVVVFASIFWGMRSEVPAVSEAVEKKSVLSSTGGSPSLQEPSAADLELDRAVTRQQQLTKGELQARELLARGISDLANCHQTYSCPQDFSDPRASDIKQGRMLADKLEEYADFHRQRDYFDEESAEVARTFLDHPDGFVQEAAIDLVSMQAPSEANGHALINALKDGYDAKVMEQAMKELQRYPGLQPEIDQLLAESLQTGSFYVAQEVALNILPHLNAENVQMFEQVVSGLPQHSVRAKALKSNIREFRLRQSGG